MTEQLSGGAEISLLSFLLNFETLSARERPLLYGWSPLVNLANWTRAGKDTLFAGFRN